MLTSLFFCECAVGQETFAPKPDRLFDGFWTNDRGSDGHFETRNGLISGSYQTNAGQPDKRQAFPLAGFAQGDQITFTVNFGEYGSMTSWTGQLTEDAAGSYIRTLWRLTRGVPDADEDQDLRKSITAGASTFRPQKKRGTPRSSKSSKD